MSRRFLPDDFPGKTLSSIERRKLEDYYEQFAVRRLAEYSQGHFVLACYAALPAVLTPDLVHKLWLNFKNYTFEEQRFIIHPVAPVDFLLSGLVEEIGFELYEMVEPVRKSLLQYIKQMEDTPNHPLQLFTLTDVAEFLRDYAQYDFTPENPDDNAFREAQTWTALSYLDPARAFSLVARAFHESNSNVERIRYKDVIEKMSGRFSLAIVKDEAQIPEGFRAMTTLTSVVRDVILNRQPAQMQQFKQEVANASGTDLTSTPTLGKDIINIEIPAKVVEKMEGKAKAVPGKLRALFVGVDHKLILKGVSEDNAAYMANIIGSISTAQQTEPVLLLGPDSTKEKILHTWKEIVAAAGKNDDLLFYLSASAEKHEGHCFVYCHDSILKDRRSSLMDEELGNIASEARCASVTIIIDTDAASTPYWMNISDPINVLLCSNKNKQASSWYQIEHENRQISPFTFYLGKILKEKEGSISNRDLFLSFMGESKRYYQSPVIQQNIAKHKSFLDTDSPQLYCHPSALNRLFARGIDSRSEMQTLLRQAGYYHDRNTGLWDKSTAEAVLTCRKELNLPATATKQDYIHALKQIVEKPSASPVWLFIYSDPEQELKELSSEKLSIPALIEEKMRRLNAEPVILENPTRQAITDFLKEPSYRNRVQLVYYSGLDDKGDFKLVDGKFSFLDLGNLLQFQENIYLFISNTCNSASMAEYLAQWGVYMSIGALDLVDDDRSAAFAKQLFTVISRDAEIRKFMEEYLSSGSENSALTKINQFNLFNFPWNQRNRNPLAMASGQKENKQQPLNLHKHTIYALIIGINDTGNRAFNTTGFSVDNAHLFKQYLEYNWSDAELILAPINESMTRMEAAASFGLFNRAEEGDTCLLFYSGIAVADTEMDKGFHDFVFTDDTEETLLQPDLITMKDRLEELIGKKKMQIVVIADFHSAVMKEAGFQTSPTITPNKHGSYICIQNRSPHKLLQGKDNNWFFESLMELLRDNNQVSYKTLFDRLVLRMSQTEERNRPKMLASPADAASLLFLSRDTRANSQYSVLFDHKINQWILNAGTKKGIRPSMGFMNTLFRLSSGTIVAIDQVEEYRATLTEPVEADRSVALPAEFIQNAMPKIRIAYDQNIATHQKERLQDTIRRNKIYFIDIIENVQSAKYLIAADNGKYFLKTKTTAQEKIQPVFTFESNPFEFLKQMEYIAQWQAVLEFDNTNSSLSKADLHTGFELIEGVTDIEMASGVIENNPDRIILHYRHGRAPAFRCALSNRSHQGLYATMIYLGSKYGIEQIDSIVLKPGGEPEYFGFMQEYNKYNTFHVNIDNRYIEMGKTEIYDYIKIFISDQPLDITALTQESLNLEEKFVSRAIEKISKREKSFELTGIEWTTLTIPVKIVNSEHNKQEPDNKK